MAKYQVGDIWNIEDKLVRLFFTANSLIRDQRLVMGVGFAEQIRDRWPEAPQIFADLIQRNGDRDYHLIEPVKLGKWKGRFYSVGALQTKQRPRDKSPITLVQESVNKLCDFANEHRSSEFHCPMPGVGLGGLNYWTVLEMTCKLPANVTFWITQDTINQYK